MSLIATIGIAKYYYCSYSTISLKPRVIFQPENGSEKCSKDLSNQFIVFELL